jgi:DtxR family Mn-dependent transcriptional regulator
VPRVQAVLVVMAHVKLTSKQPPLFLLLKKAKNTSTAGEAESVHRLNMAKETYVETIYELTVTQGSVSVTDIARALNVKPSSVTEMLKKLDFMGYVKYKPYRSVTLTVKGEELAVFLKQAQLSLQCFFKVLNVEEPVAQEDACKIEHVLHAATLKNLSVFIATMQNTVQGKALLEVFHKKQRKTAGTIQNR